MSRQRQLVVISGCSGGGKSTLIAELARCGYPTVEEPARRLIRERRQAGELGDLPMQALVEAYLLGHRSVGRERGLVFFDRSLLDAVNWYHQTGRDVPGDIADLVERTRYHDWVFVVPPWPEIFENDAERRHGLKPALAEYESLLWTYPHYGYEVVEVPKVSVSERVDFVLRELR